MAVYINEECISCDACVDECPNGAIVSNDDNPNGEDIYFVHENKCDECGGMPSCQSVCPSDAIKLRK